jgi:hypothetical protein
MSNALYYGDNLTVLRESIKDESVDPAAICRFKATAAVFSG